MREVINKIIPGILLGLIGCIATAFFQVRDNAAALQLLTQEVQEIEAKHIRRLENLEYSKETMSDYYVTRREFNLVVQTLDERMKKVDRNVEKLLDIQMNKKE